MRRHRIRYARAALPSDRTPWDLEAPRMVSGRGARLRSSRSSSQVLHPRRHSPQRGFGRGRALASFPLPRQSPPPLLGWALFRAGAAAPAGVAWLLVSGSVGRREAWRFSAVPRVPPLPSQMTLTLWGGPISVRMNAAWVSLEGGAPYSLGVL